MSGITTKLRDLSRWLRHIANHEPEPECKASHIECADDCNDAAEEIDFLQARLSEYEEAQTFTVMSDGGAVFDLIKRPEKIRTYAESSKREATKDAEIARLREALSVIAYPLNIGKVYHMDAVTQARAALAQVAEVGK